MGTHLDPGHFQGPVTPVVSSGGSQTGEIPSVSDVELEEAIYGEIFPEEVSALFCDPALQSELRHQASVFELAEPLRRVHQSIGIMADLKPLIEGVGLDTMGDWMALENLDDLPPEERGDFMATAHQIGEILYKHTEPVHRVWVENRLWELAEEAGENPGDQSVPEGIRELRVVGKIYETVGKFDEPLTPSDLETLDRVFCQAPSLWDPSSQRGEANS